MRPRVLILAAPPLLATALFAACSENPTAPENRRPVARITAPGAGTRVVEHQALTLSGSATDAEDGVLGAPALRWASDLDGALGSGYSVVVRLSAGTHVITLIATDGSGLADTATVAVRAEPAGTLDLTLVGVQLNQGSQDAGGTIGGVAGRAGLLRVVVKANEENTATPVVRVRLFREGALVREARVRGPSTGVPREPDLGRHDPSDTWDLPLASEEVVEGLAVAAWVDPDGDVPEPDEDDNVLPRGDGAPASRSLDVDPLPRFDLVFVPVEATRHGTIGAVTPANADQYVRATLQRTPIGALDVTVHPVLTTDADLATGEGWSRLLNELQALRTLEGATARYYHGIVGYFPGVAHAGLAYVLASPSSPDRSALSIDLQPHAAAAIAHEIGHNLGRHHTPCGGVTDPDPDYPDATAHIGAPGYDILAGALVWSRRMRDYMSYCEPEWTSDYTYRGILAWRRSDSLATAAPGRNAVRASPTRGLLIWGRISSAGAILNPAFELDAAPSLPREAGPNRVRGVDARGAEIFAISFRGTPVADGTDPSEQQFAFFVPLGDAALRDLDHLELTTPSAASVRRSVAVAAEPGAPDPGAPAPGVRREDGPDGVRFRWDPEAYPMAIVRDAATGRILGFARSGAAAVRREAAGADRIELLVSDGVRTRRIRRP